MSSLPIFVVMPALNEEQSIPLVLGSLRARPPKAGRICEMIVVDNGSTDRTADVARARGATVLQQRERGYGAACLTALQHIAKSPEILGRKEAIVVFLDADYSDYPEDMEKLVRPIVEDRADFVLGSRLIFESARRAVPLPARVGNRVASTALHFLFRQRFTDLGPFRAIRYGALTQLEMRDRNWGWTIEMQVRACRRGLRILEVPVRYRIRHAGTSKISGSLVGGIFAGAKILWILALAIVDSCRRAPVHRLPRRSRFSRSLP